MASRAIYALSRVPDICALTLLSRATADPRQEVRIAVAASVSKLKPNDADSILLKLLTDAELGVRKYAVKAVSGTHNAAVHAMLRDIETRDPAPSIRDLAKSRLRELQLIGP
jgi:HEAT repeat protein